MIQKFSISNDPAMYEAWPDVVLTGSGKLVCVFSECTHHGNRDYTRIMLSDSGDRGRHWSPKRPLTEGTRGLPYYYNCARISRLRDGRLVVVVDRIPADGGESRAAGPKTYSTFQPTTGRAGADRSERRSAASFPTSCSNLKTGAGSSRPTIT